MPTPSELLTFSSCVVGPESRKQIRILLDGLPEALMLVALDGQIEFANTAAARLFGYVPSELEGQNATLLFGSSSAAEQPWKEGAETAEPTAFYEAAGHCKDGTVLSFEISVITLVLDDRTRWVVTLRNLPSRRHVEQALREEVAWKQSVFDAMADGVVVVDAGGVIRLVNPAAARLFGYEVDELLEEDIGRFVLSLDVNTSTDVRRCSTLDGSTERLPSAGQAVGYHKDGTTLTLDMSPGVFSEELGPCLVCIVRQSTDDQLGMPETSSQESALEADRVCGGDCTRLKPEVQVSIGSIVDTLNLLLEGALSLEQQEAARATLQSTEKLIASFQGEHPSPEAGTSGRQPDLLSFDLLQLLHDTASLFVQEAAERDLELVVRLVPGSSRYLVGHSAWLRQVLAGFLDNAMKHARQGHVVLTAKEILHPGMQEGASRLRLSVKTTGVGTPADPQWPPFRDTAGLAPDVSEACSESEPTLAASRSLVEALGSEVGMKSQVGESTVIWCDLSLQRDEGATAAVLDSDALEGLRILIVNDVAEIRRLLYESLVEASLDCVACCTGEEAIKVLRQATEERRPYHVVLVDQTLPGMSDGRLVREMRVGSVLRDLAVVVLAETPEATSGKELWGTGLSEVLLKPVHLDELNRLLSSMARSLALGGSLQRPPARPDRNAGGTASQIVSDGGSAASRILLVEDCRVNQLFASQTLRSLGCQVTVAVNGKEAVELATKQTFDLVFMDCEMPEMDGLEASRILTETREKGGSKQFYIVGLTGHGDERKHRECLAAGMDAVLVKPISEELLLGALTDWLPREAISVT